jgi:hypothetical protein
MRPIQGETMAVTHVSIPVWESSLTDEERKRLHTALQMLSAQGIPTGASQAPASFEARAKAAARARQRTSRRMVAVGSARRFI